MFTGQLVADTLLWLMLVAFCGGVGIIIIESFIGKW